MSVSITEFDAQQPFVMYCFFCFEYLSCPSMVLPRSCTGVCTPSLARKDVPFVAPVLSFFLPPKGVFQHRFGRARAVYPSYRRNSPPASHASAFRPISASNLLPSATDLAFLPPPSTIVVFFVRISDAVRSHVDLLHRHASQARRSVPPALSRKNSLFPLLSQDMPWKVSSPHREETLRMGSTSLVLNSFVNSSGVSSTCSCSSCFACCASRARFEHASRAIGGQEALQGRPGRQQEVWPRRTRKDRRFRKENRRRNHELESGKKDVA